MNAQTPWRTFTIFVSSTFLDMEAERDYLNNLIARKLEHEFEKQHVSLRFIDLRWGVHTDKNEAKELREASVLKVCLEEIKRSRPFFVAILGDRYGWVPPHERYQQILQSLDEDERPLLREGEGASVTALEILYGALGDHSLLNHSLFYFRDKASYEGMTPEERATYQDPEYADRQLSLKEKIQQECAQNGLEDNVQTYKLHWKEGRFTGLEEWGQIVENQLRREIEKEIAETDQSTPKDWYGMEELQHDIFVHDKTELFTGREALLKELTDFACRHTGIKVISGWKTQGKSAILCKLYATLSELKDPDRILLLHCAGISIHSCYTFRMFCRWSRQLCNVLGLPYIEPEKESEQERRMFLELVRKATQAGKKVTILIDATENFYPSDDACNYEWLPEEASVFVTTIRTEESEYTEEITRYKPYAEVIPLPYLEREEARELIIRRCESYHKNIAPRVVETMLNKKSDITEEMKKQGLTDVYGFFFPLWLVLITDYLILMGADDYSKANESDETDNELKLENYLCQVAANISIDGGAVVTNRFIPRLVADNDKGFVMTVLSLIAISYRGLRENDLTVILGNQWDELTFAKLHYYLQNILVEDYETGCWRYRHQHIADCIDMMSSETFKASLHNGLSRYYFYKKKEGGPVWASSAIYHMFHADQKDLVATLYASAIDEEWNRLDEMTSTICERIKENPAQNLEWFIDMVCYPLEESPTLKAPEFTEWLYAVGYAQLYEYATKSLFPALKNIQKEMALHFALGIEETVTCFCKGSKQEENILQPFYLAIADIYDKNKDIPHYKKYIQLAKGIKQGNETEQQETENYLDAEQGRIAMHQGRYQTAETHLLRSFRRCEAEYKQNPASPETCGSMLINSIQLFDLYDQWEKKEKRESYIQQALACLPHIPTNDYKGIKYAGAFYERAGRYYISTGDIEKAEKAIKKCIDYYRQLHEMQLDNAEDTILLGIAYESMGSYYEELFENYAKAYEYYCLQYTTFKNVLDKDPSNIECIRFTTIAIGHITSMLSEMGRNRETIPYHWERLHLLQQLGGQYTERKELMDMAFTYWELSDCLKEYPEAFNLDTSQDNVALLLRNAIELYATAYQKYSDNGCHYSLVVCLYNLFLHCGTDDMKQKTQLFLELWKAYQLNPGNQELDPELTAEIQRLYLILAGKEPTKKPLFNQLFEDGKYQDAIMEYNLQEKHTPQEKLLYGLCLLRTHFPAKAEELFCKLRQENVKNEIAGTATANLLLCFLLRKKIPEYETLHASLSQSEQESGPIQLLQQAYREWEAQTRDTRPWYKRMFSENPLPKQTPVKLTPPYGWEKLF